MGGGWVGGGGGGDQNLSAFGDWVIPDGGVSTLHKRVAGRKQGRALVVIFLDVCGTRVRACACFVAVCVCVVRVCKRARRAL